MESILHSELFILCLNLGAYILGGWLLRILHIRFLNALFVALFIVIGVLLLLKIDYQTYYEGSRILNFLLGPSVVALGYVLHKQIKHLKGNVTSILIAILVGAFVNLISINLILHWIGSDLSIIYSLQPKSVTTPIALSLSEKNQGIASLTAIAVVITGLLGSVLGPLVLRKARINNPIAKGLALGSSAHAIGTSKALEIGAVEGAISGLAIGLMGAATALVLSFFSNFLL